MKTFIKKVLLLFVICFSFVNVVNIFYIAKKGNEINEDAARFVEVPNDIQICSFGNSHALYAYNFDDLSKQYNCFNFSLSAQTISYDLRILKQYKDHLAKNAVVFITVSDISLYGDLEKNTDKFKSKNLRYYYFLDPSLIKEYDPFERIWILYPSLNVSITDLLRTFLNRESSSKDFETKWKRVATEEEIKLDASGAVKRHLGSFIDYDNNFVYNQEEIDSLNEMIELCISFGFRPILVSTPLSAEYMRLAKEEYPSFYEDYRQLVRQIADKYKLNYYDYSEDARIVNNNDFFRDSDHLNYDGSIYFTNILTEEIINKQDF